jgi:hypothetical protein
MVETLDNRTIDNITVKCNSAAKKHFCIGILILNNFAI